MVEERDSVKMKSQQNGTLRRLRRAWQQAGVAAFDGLGISRERFAISGGLFDGGDDLLRGIKDIVGG